MNHEKNHLTVKEVAALTRFKPQTVRKWVSAGRITAAKVGHEIRISAEELKRLGFSVPGS